MNGPLPTLPPAGEGSAKARVGAALAVALVALWCGPAASADLNARLSEATLQQVFPGAQSVAPAPGLPAALAVTVGGNLAGYVFSTREVVNATGYNGFPFDLIGGITLDGRVTGAALLEHHESILGRGVGPEGVTKFLSGFAGATLDDWRAVNPDAMRGASTSARLFKAGMQRSANQVFTTYVLGGARKVVTQPTLDQDTFAPLTLDEQIAIGAVSHVVVTGAEMLAAFARRGGAGAKPDEAIADPAQPFLDLYVALANPAGVGLNLFGDRRHALMMSRAAPDGVVIWLASNGAFSFAGPSRFSAAAGYAFDRFLVVQGDKEARMTRDNYEWAIWLNGPRENPKDFMAFFLRPSPIDALKPWHIEMAIPGTAADGTKIAVNYPVSYRLPERFILRPLPARV